MPDFTVCRLCDSACGVLVHSEAGRLASITTDPADPVGGGRPCRSLAYVPSVLSHSERITTPLRREGDGFVPASWEEALEAVGGAMRSVRSDSGADALGVYLGGDRWSRSRETVRALAFGVAAGTPHIFSESVGTSSPLLRAAERMLGHPALLLSDLSRAHYVVVFDGGQPETGWGSTRRGGTYGDALAHSVRTKGTKVVVVGPRRTPLADTAHQYVPIAPGTEAFFLLGMLSAAVKGGWRDAQYIRDYTEGWDQLAELLAGWPVERCAEICGVDAAQISGVALKFGRAAMAVAHLDARVWSSPNASLAAWAGLALHTITANTLRPGGLYDHLAPIDLHHPLAFLPTEKAPQTAGGDPLFSLQAPSEALADLLGSPVKALLVVEGDPATTAADPNGMVDKLSALDLLVVCARFHSATTACADWVLPVTHPFEEGELEVLGSAALPEPMVRQVRPAVQAPEGCWPAEHVLRGLGAQLRPGWRGGPYGVHLGLAGRHLLKAELDGVEAMVLEWGADIDTEALDTPPHRVERGMADRSLWRVSHAGGRIQLAPDAARLLLDAAVVPASGAAPFRLRTSVPRGPEPDALHGLNIEPVAHVHPDSGLPDGARAIVRSTEGELAVTIRHDARLRADVVDIPRGVPGVGVLIAASPRDPWTHMPAWDGSGCEVVVEG